MMREDARWAAVRQAAEAARSGRSKVGALLPGSDTVEVKYVCYRYADLFVNGRDCGRFLWDYGVNAIADKAMLPMTMTEAGS